MGKVKYLMKEHGRMFTKEVEMIDWEEYFVYDLTSPTGLRWKKDVLAGRTGKTKIVLAGDPAGHLTSNSNGTRKTVDVGFRNKHRKAHRIVWEMHYGEIPKGMVIDHLDQNPWNNDVLNLALKTKSENHRNTKLTEANTSGKVGVYWHSMNKGKHTYAVARVQVDNREFSRRFATHKFGLLPAFKMACEWRTSKVNELNEKLNANFTELHGQRLKYLRW